MPFRVNSFNLGLAMAFSAFLVLWAFPATRLMANPDTESLQDALTLQKPWELRATPRPSMGGLSTLSDDSPETTSSITRRVLRLRSIFQPLFIGIPCAIPEAPGLLVFSNIDEMHFTLRTRLAVSDDSHAPALSFENEKGQFVAVATDQRNSLALNRALQAAALEQMLPPLFEDRLPPWARVGLLQYAGSLHWREDRLVSGEACSGLVDALRSPGGDLGLVPFERMLTLDEAGWEDFELRRGPLRMQANAWLVVHYLIHGENGRLVPYLKDWLHAVAIGRDGDLDLAARLAPVFSLEAFQNALVAHARSLTTGTVGMFREQVELLRILMQELEDSSIRPVDSNALKLELDLLANREIELHASPFMRRVAYTGVEFFDSCSFHVSPTDHDRVKGTDPSAVSAPMGLLFVHPTGESVRIDWISTSSGWKSVVAW